MKLGSHLWPTQGDERPGLALWLSWDWPLELLFLLQGNQFPSKDWRRLLSSSRLRAHTNWSTVDLPTRSRSRLRAARDSPFHFQRNMWNFEPCPDTRAAHLCRPAPCNKFDHPLDQLRQGCDWTMLALQTRHTWCPDSKQTTVASSSACYRHCRFRPFSLQCVLPTDRVVQNTHLCHDPQSHMYGHWLLCPRNKLLRLHRLWCRHKCTASKRRASSVLAYCHVVLRVDLHVAWVDQRTRDDQNDAKVPANACRPCQRKGPPGLHSSRQIRCGASSESAHRLTSTESTRPRRRSWFQASGLCDCRCNDRRPASQRTFYAAYTTATKVHLDQKSSTECCPK